MSDERAENPEDDPLTRTAEAVGTAIGSAAHTVTEAAQTRRTRRGHVRSSTRQVGRHYRGNRRSGAAEKTAAAGRAASDRHVERDHASRQDGQSRNKVAKKAKKRRQDSPKTAAKAKAVTGKGQGAQTGREEVSRKSAKKRKAKAARSRPSERRQRRPRKPRPAMRKAEEVARKRR